MVEWEAGEGRAGGGKKACTARRGRRRRGRRSWRRRKGCGRMALFGFVKEEEQAGAGQAGCCCSCDVREGVWGGVERSNEKRV